LINEYLKDEYGFKVGKQLNITVLVGENVTKIIKLRVIGIIKALPGIVSIYVMKSRPVIVISYNYLQNNTYIQKLLHGYGFRQYLIDVSENVNSTEIAEKLEEHIEIRSATSIEQVMRKYLNDPLITIFSLKFCYIEYIFALTIATFGVISTGGNIDFRKGKGGRTSNCERNDQKTNSKNGLWRSIANDYGIFPSGHNRGFIYSLWVLFTFCTSRNENILH